MCLEWAWKANNGEKSLNTQKNLEKEIKMERLKGEAER